MLRRHHTPLRSLRAPAVVLAAALAVSSLAGCASDAGQAEPGLPASSGATRAAYETPAVSPAASLEQYVAMGDSYTAAPLFPLNDDNIIDDCLRSTSNYPTLVASALDVSLTDVSCSGASTISIFADQKFTSKVMPPQINALQPDTDLVTIGIGANDFTFFSDMVFDCLDVADLDVQGDPCRQSNADARGRDTLRRNLVKIKANVARVVTAIRERAPEARVLLVGYPQIIPSTGTCRARLPLALGDYAYVLDLNLRLAEAVREGGTSAGAEYVDMVAASKGHDICAEEPWVAGIRGKDNRAAGLHPYPQEQEAVAELVLDQL